MTLQYDPEFIQDAAPFLHLLSQFPKPALHDITSRRTLTSAMMSPLPQMPDDIEQFVHHVHTIDGHQVAIHHFRRKQCSNQSFRPAVVHMHGGGYIALSAIQCALPHITSVQATGVQVLTIDYRLAPENPYPTPLYDCWAALQWIYSNAKILLIDISRIAIMGEGSGGGLAAALAIMARDHALWPPIAKQILIHPMLDDRTTSNYFRGLAFWDEVDNMTGWTAYLGSRTGTDEIDSYAVPARVANVEGLPMLYLDCPQLDIFVHEGLDYARRFLAANIPTELHIYPGMPQGFELMAPLASTTQYAITNRYKAMRSL